jgi:predicted ArsR family transcriptional regulator
MDDIETIAALDDPLRRRLYDYVVAHGGDVSRGEAAEAAGVQRTLAAFHLDKLVEAGLLDAVFRRTSGRTGPGAGRPAKLYRRAAREYAVSLPPRDYATAANLLAEVVEALGAEPEAHAVAARHGRSLGLACARPGPGGAARPKTEIGRVERALARQGYAPYREGGCLRSRNCPFHALATRFPPLVCGMNLALFEGLLEGLEATALVARLDPRPGECCVSVSKNKKC